MKFYDNNVRQLIDFSQLLDLIRDAKIYSIAVVPVNERYEVHAEVVMREEGIHRLTLKNYGHVSFPDEATARRILTESLKAHDPQTLDWHLLGKDGEHLLCGPLKDDGKTQFRTTDPERFFSDGARLGGPRCRRCKTQAFVFGLYPDSAAKPAERQA